MTFPLTVLSLYVRIGPMLEKDVEKRVCDFAKSLGCTCYKFVSPSKRSVPDRIFHFQGLTWYVEFKRPGVTKATPAQEIEHAKLRAQKIDVFVCNDVTIGKAIISDMVSNGFHVP